MYEARMRWFFAVSNFVTATLVFLAVFEGLPTRWWPIDGAGGVVAAAYVVTGIVMIRPVRFSDWIVRVLCGLILAIGLGLIAILAISASHLAGIYGPIGRGSALLLLLVLALAIPYLVALPAAQLIFVWKKK